MRWLLVAMLVGCGAPPRQQPAPAPAPAPAPPPREVVVPAPAPPPQPAPQALQPREMWIIEGRHRLQDPDWGGRDSLPAAGRDVAASDLWSPCVREHVQAQPAHVRRALTAAFARHVASCDADRRVVITPAPSYRGKAAIRFAGPLAELALVATACREFDTLAIDYDRKRWTSGPLVTESRDGCTVATLPNTPTMRALLRDVIAARTVRLRFGDHDAVLADDIKRDLRLMLDALDALTAP